MGARPARTPASFAEARHGSEGGRAALAPRRLPGAPRWPHNGPMGRLETSGFYALGIPLYLALIAIEVATARRRGRSIYGFANTIGNFSGGLGGVILGLFIGPWLIALYDFTFENFALVRWPEGSWVPWLLSLFLADMCYYWYHRAGHRVAGLWAIHGVHHQSEAFNISIATRHPWMSDFYSAIFYAPLPLLGVPPTHFFVVITLISFYALTVHSHFFNRPSLFIFVTPRSHIVHHARNPRYIGKNLGAMFTLWDRLFGTHVDLDPDDPPELGTPAGYQTHDGALSQWLFFRDLIALARQTPRWADKLKVFTSPPGWRPPGAAPVPHPPARPEASISPRTRAYVGLQFALTVLASIHILWLRESHPFWLLAASAALILWGTSTLGGLLDGRTGAPRRELARLAAAAALCAWMIATPGYQLVAAVMALAMAACALWLALDWRRFNADAAS